ncbi:carboxypeptidase-like regulatory domain-containing protein [Mucilaginibacter sp. UR6-11]|uniref:carboxypeptidase-like regulatory domain-containing protein n=1 Tax=Mucilaginibacter sp. UR6-11 TaxID=1435644 RepID=UPI001E320BB5|nr:carboxypeptidase-like regulatory domain-containing protein [Mucilaginibacter sp. UR6-11]MCC8424264.1 carboxypeptidase-like regulatory domain-containing protein [Mucilaginibacter sp. UR6-11]
MKTVRLLLVFIAFLNVCATAQGHYNVMGTIADSKGKPVNGATVFMSGSEKITATNTAGQFIFYNIDPGAFQLSVKMLGYAYCSKDIVIQDKSVEVNISLKEKPIALTEVKIGPDAWERNYRIFKDEFLDTTPNGKECTILNPQVLNFSTMKLGWGRILLKADADEFLIIENKRLGYGVHYLLKTFENNGLTGITSYDGDAVFEEMDGTPEMKKNWAKNRLEAYKGSFMHFLRSVYANTTLDEGFITHQMYPARGSINGIYMDTRPVNFDTLVTPIDTSFISLKFTSLYIIYDPRKAGKLKSQGITSVRNKVQQTDVNAEMISNSKILPDSANFKTLVTSGPNGVSPAVPATVKVSPDVNNASQIILNLREAIIDAKGSYTDYRTFFLRKNWGKKRVGDQLPFEYQPPAVNN